MAKKSMLARELKRERTVLRYGEKREQLKKMVRDVSLSEEERWNAQLKLQALPRDASPVRLRTRCFITGRPNAVYRRFGLCRNKIREEVMSGNIPGIRCSSW